MVRVAILLRKFRSESQDISPDGMDPEGFRNSSLEARILWNGISIGDSKHWPSFIIQRSENASTTPCSRRSYIDNTRALKLLFDGSYHPVQVSAGSLIVDTKKELPAQHASSD